MLLAGSQTAPSACLRLQLREILLTLSSGRTLQRRHLSAASPVQEEAQLEKRDPIVIRPERSYVYRHIHPHGRIIGKPGRRQRQSSEQLATASLGKPSEVIVLRDVIEKPVRKDRTVGVEPNGAAILDEGVSRTAVIASALQTELAGDEAEAIASIEELRPEHVVIDEQNWKELQRTLLERYNLRQLTTYLVEVSRLAQTKSDQPDVGQSNAIHVTAWQPGRTSMEHRVGRISLEKRELGRSKAKIADRILHSAWGLTVATEAKVSGELELYVRPWQLSLMFDVKRKGRVAMEAFIASPLLMRAADIRARKEENVVRITASKTDAEEIALRLQQKLALVVRDELDLSIFAPLLGKPGWPDTLGELFSGHDLALLTERTQSVFVREDDSTLAIYNMPSNKAESAHARRLLLSLLDLPSPLQSLSMNISDEDQDTGLGAYVHAHSAVSHTAYPVMDAHQRHKAVSWFRIMAAITKPGLIDRAEEKRLEKLGMEGLEWWTIISKRLAYTLKSTSPARRSVVKDEDSAGWAIETSEPEWTVKFGAFLHTRSNASALADATTKTLGQYHKTDLSKQPGIFHDQHMGLVALLSNFTPARHSLRTPPGQTLAPAQQLIVHLTPSPYIPGIVEALHTLPRVLMDFKVAAPDHRRVRVPSLTSVVATLSRQELNVAFPDYSSDLCFLREGKMALKPDAWNSNGQLTDVVRGLEVALATETGGLPAMAHVGIDLPQSLLPLSSTQADDVSTKPVPYYVSHYEHISSVDYVPLHDEARFPQMDPKVVRLARKWPKSMVLRCREVDAGAFGGRRTEVSLVRCPSDTASGQDVQQERKPKEAEMELATTAMRILRLMTRAHAGQLPSPYDATS
ncbi:hypothetical protein LTR17_013426 [Elasticomyces elasticus]|nr:hypothetical protein LTR17_013426 [Elasticomyces elasticus]